MTLEISVKFIAPLNLTLTRTFLKCYGDEIRMILPNLCTALVRNINLKFKYSDTSSGMINFINQLINEFIALSIFFNKIFSALHKMSHLANL